jgi:hypothetical protein
VNQDKEKPVSVGVMMEAQAKEGCLEDLKKLLADILPDTRAPRFLGCIRWMYNNAKS